MAAFTLWCWASAALLFALVAAAQLSHAGEGLPRRAFAGALAATALWALATAGIDARELGPRIAEAGRTLAWLGFMWALARRGEPHARGAVGAVYAVAALVVFAALGLAVGEAALAGTAPAILGDARLLLLMMVAVSALVLTHHLHAAAARGRRGGLRLVVAGLAAMWSGDLALHSIAYLLGGWTPGLGAARAIATLLLAPALGLAAHRGGEWTLHVSRTVALRSLSALALALYLGGTLLAISLIELLGGPYVRVAQTAFVFGSTAALLTLLANPWLRGWVRVKVALHLFRHRYDYRAEWVRFTDTLGRPGDAAAPLERRIVKAVADVTCSPAGLLIVPENEGLGVAAGWNWEAAEPGGEPLARHLAATGRIVELDAVRAGSAEPEDRGAVPAWLLVHEEAWVIVPLMHFDRLVGAIVLARPPVDRALDWEDFDLLRIAGRQVASYLAEARALEELADARRFDEFHRRFAFILHDIKNLVSQLSLVARNAERHAENPAFRADMVATLKESADRMNALLARLSLHGSARGETATPVEVAPLARSIARRAPGRVSVEGAARPAMADPVLLEQLLIHLVQNAVEASGAGAPVTVRLADAGEEVLIEVVDRGCGMSPAFVRDELFRPFHSSKPGGFGLGAFEARQLAEAMAGSVSVESREGEGTRFQVRLPGARAMEKAA